MSSAIINFQNSDPAQIREMITGNKALVKLVSESMGVEAFTEAALQIIRQPGIAACTQDSVLGAMLKAAIFKFRISPELGQCWIVPRSVNIGTRERPNYANVATFQIGYKGWQELSFRSGLVESFDSNVVFEGDVFEFRQGTNPFLNHVPTSKANQGKRTHVWASAVMNSGRVVFDVQTIEEVERHRRMSSNQKGDIATGMWADHYDMMARRIPMRYLCSLKLPKSDTLNMAIESDGASFNMQGEVVEKVSVGEIQELSEVAPTIHEDYLMEIDACQTVEALRKLAADRKNEIPAEQQKEYISYLSKKAQALGATIKK
jgi:phage RecT family recombinase